MNLRKLLAGKPLIAFDTTGWDQPADAALATNAAGNIPQAAKVKQKVGNKVGVKPGIKPRA